MPDLISRLEGASEGSRELDIAVWEHIGRPSIIPLTGLHPDDWITRIGDRWVAATRWGTGGCSGDRICLRYTKFLDAALTLVPEGCDYDIGHIKQNGSPIAYVMREVMKEKHYYISHRGKAPTPAIALCIAALKARESNHG